VVRWFLDADGNPDSHENLINSFLAHLQGVLEICMQIHSVLFAFSRQINKQKVCENN